MKETFDEIFSEKIFPQNIIMNIYFLFPTL